jgi:hypothetical protein
VGERGLVAELDRAHGERAVAAAPEPRPGAELARPAGQVAGLAAGGEPAVEARQREHLDAVARVALDRWAQVAGARADGKLHAHEPGAEVAREVGVVPGGLGVDPEGDRSGLRARRAGRFADLPRSHADGEHGHDDGAQKCQLQSSRHREPG